MKISVFTCIWNPEYWCFPYEEALKSYLELADEVIVVDGGSTDGSLKKIKEISDKIRIVSLLWPAEYLQREFPLHLNWGFRECLGDWAIKFDIDFVLHDFDAVAFRRKLSAVNENPDIWLAAFHRYNIFNRFEGIEKDCLPWAIHKKFTKEKILFGIDRRHQFPDWSQAVIVEKFRDNVPIGYTHFGSRIIRLGNPIYNYDCTFRTKEKCKLWFQRAARAYLKETGHPVYGENDEMAWEMWKNIRYKQKKRMEKIPLKIEDHPIFIQNKIKNMTPNMWGHSNWSWDL